MWRARTRAHPQFGQRYNPRTSAAVLARAQRNNSSNNPDQSHGSFANRGAYGGGGNGTTHRGTGQAGGGGGGGGGPGYVPVAPVHGAAMAAGGSGAGGPNLVPMPMPLMMMAPSGVMMARLPNGAWVTADAFQKIMSGQIPFAQPSPGDGGSGLPVVSGTAPNGQAVAPQAAVGTMAGDRAPGVGEGGDDEGGAGQAGGAAGGGS